MAGEAPVRDQGTDVPLPAARARASIGVVPMAGRRSRCLVLVPEHLASEDADRVRTCRRGVVAWSGEVPHFTADVDEGRRLHVLGDDADRSVYTLGRNGRASLREDFWPATLDLSPAEGAGADAPAVVPRASRPVWAALGAGAHVQPQDVVVVILSDPAQPAQLHGGTGRGSARSVLRGAAAAVVGVATLLLGVLTAVAVSPALLGDGDRRGSSAPGGATLTRFDAHAARVRGNHITVFQRPASRAAPVRSFPAVGDYGAPQTFLVEREQRHRDGVWYEVLLPVRPNGTTGWVRAADVDVVGLPYRIKVHLGALRLELFRDGRLEATFPIGIGTVDTPTPPGRYSIRYLMRPDDQNTLFGHFVYGLSGFSDVVRDVPRGGELGIHGTNDPEHSIGRRVSQGCIRLRNEDIASLVPLLPLGTPVDVVA